MRKGQLGNQVFIYLMAAIIFSMVLMYGYNAVQNFSEQSETVAMMNLQDDIESSINKIAATQDRVMKEFVVPGNHQKICFVDMSQGGQSKCSPGGGGNCEDLCYTGDPDIPPLVCNAWRSNLTQNVFLIPLSELQFKTAPLEVQDAGGNDVGANCLNLSGGRVDIVLRGKGDRAVIRPQS